MDSRPIEASMLLRSDSEHGMYRMDQPAVYAVYCVGGHQFLLAEVFVHPNANQPALAVGIRIHRFRSGHQCRIRFDHFAGDGTEDLRDGLHRFNRPEWFSGFHFGAHFREFDEHDIAEFILCVVGDTDGARYRRRSEAIRVPWCTADLRGS